MWDVDVNTALKSLETKKGGLSEKEVTTRLKRFGFNELVEEARFSALKIALSQFKDPLVIILIVAVIISVVVRHFLDASVIAAILIINAVLGFVQEYKAEKAVAMLKKLRPQKTKVIRSGVEKIILSKNLVPGDVIVLETGDKVPADARLMEAVNLQVNESSLTGESTPVEKRTEVISEKKVPLAERNNMVFSGTIISKGRGKAAVSSTGMKTQLGQITRLVQVVEEVATPLQKRLKHLGNWLGILIVIICLIVLSVGILRGKGFVEMFMVALSLAVSAVPEGLPAVVTVCLTIGLRRMLKRKSLIRKLKAIETLGCVTVIASDKTGTITCNEMTVTNLFVNNKDVKVSGKGYNTKGEFFIGNQKVNPKSFELLLKIGSSCNDATLEIGDPTEIALIVAAAKGGILKEEKRVSEIPFDSDRKFMATTHPDGFTYVKGASEKILSMCDYILVDGKRRRIIKRDKEKILAKNKEFAKKALRVLGFAYTKKSGLKDLCFVGLTGMIDPPRSEVKEAIKICRIAGIRPVMITGDHAITAKAVGGKVGILGQVLTGLELDDMGDEHLKRKVKEVSIYARVSSAHKVRILKALQDNGEVVAMTGDGINDAPALKKADVGVAMNIKGTDVSREASDMILLDDNFASIVSAVREGRVIYDNIKKFVKFLLSVNFSEIALILFAIIFNLPLPLLPLQILWINLVTDSLPALALGVDPPEGNVMGRKPKPPKESIFKNTKSFIITVGIIASIASILMFFFVYKLTGDLPKARTMTLMAAIGFEMLIVFSCRSEKSIFSIGLFSNKLLVGAVAFSLGLQILMVHTPLRILLKLVPLTLGEWGIIVLVSSIGFLFFEIKKIMHRNS